jgi:hypothetical protein
LFQNQPSAGGSQSSPASSPSYPWPGRVLATLPYRHKNGGRRMRMKMMKRKKKKKKSWKEQEQPLLLLTC